MDFAESCCDSVSSVNIREQCSCIRSIACFFSGCWFEVDDICLNLVKFNDCYNIVVWFGRFVSETDLRLLASPHVLHAISAGGAPGCSRGCSSLHGPKTVDLSVAGLK